MPIVPAQCPNCAANLEVNSTQDAAICSHCGTPFIVEKAINNFQINNHITANVVNVYGSVNNDFEIVAGVLQKYRGASTDIVIPNNVIVIGAHSFDGCALITSVVMPDSVATIEAYAFNGCINLKNVRFSRSLKTINRYAFSGTGLESVDLPESVTHLFDAFIGCKSLKSVKLPDSIIDITGSFSDCTSLNSIFIPENVTIIGRSTFSNTNLQSIRIPDTVVEIGAWAFSGCKLDSIELSNNLKKIGRETFSGCENLKSITLPDSLDEIEFNAFRDCKNLKIKWPFSYRNKQVSKLLILLSMLHIGWGKVFLRDIKYISQIKDKERKAMAGEWIYSGKTEYSDGPYYHFFDEPYDEVRRNQYLWIDINKNVTWTGVNEVSKDIDSHYRELSQILSLAGLDKEALRIVSMPLYDENIFGKLKKYDSLNMIVVSLVEE